MLTVETMTNVFVLQRSKHKSQRSYYNLGIDVLIKLEKHNQRTFGGHLRKSKPVFFVGNEIILVKPQGILIITFWFEL